jgi:CheY-like chemotaxis protein
MTSILVVDDEATIRGLVAGVLEDEGYGVLQACHGAQALALALQELPDLVLTDLMMPVMNGADLVRQLKNNAATRRVPIVLMTAAGRAAAEEHDVDAVLTKPFELDALLALVTHYTGPAPVPHRQPG